MKYNVIALTQLNGDQIKKLGFLHQRVLHSLLTDLGAPFLEHYYQIARADFPAEKKTRGKGIGKRAMELILEGRTNQEIIEIIKSEIAEANPTVATMAWYRNKLRQDGLLPKPVRKAKKEAAPEVEADAETEEQDAEAVAE